MRAFLKVRTLLFAMLLSLVPAVSHAGVFISISVAPPVLPVYAQPVCPGDGYLWTPGYWAYAPAGYYWVPGVWVMPPQTGLLWTPGYWGSAGGFYSWHAGYWGPHVGFYGGVNYGFGYPGAGFIGGRWNGGHFFYNTAVLRVDAGRVRNIYVDRTVIRNDTFGNRASFNGPGGIGVRSTRQEQNFANDRRFEATSEQAAHERAASGYRGNFAEANQGRPATPAMSRPAYGGGRPDFNARPANDSYRGGSVQQSHAVQEHSPSGGGSTHREDGGHGRR